jgi:hypothetical protein
MPVHEEDGGYKYGKHGKLYKGKDAKSKAFKQGYAIKMSQLMQGKNPK